MNLVSNIFTKNLAINGGSIYCFNCELQGDTWSDNVFTGDYARNGGNMYLKDIKNDMSLTPITFDGHSHTSSYANQ